MGIDPSQFYRSVTDVLELAGLHSPKAVRLLVGTAAVESGLGTYLRQMNEGPALGVFQMEPATEEDIWSNFLAYRQALREALVAVTGVVRPDALHLRLNLIYQILMARVHYLRVAAPIPDVVDPAALGAYWKDYYNTRAGRGHVAHFVAAWDRHRLERFTWAV